jgi:hypothetical protein
MKALAVFMVLVGLAIGWGAVMEFRYFGPQFPQFWVGVFTTPASLFFVIAAIMLWRRGYMVRQLVLIAAGVLAGATVAATWLDVMGPPATILGLAGVLAAAVWAWRSRAVVV